MLLSKFRIINVGRLNWFKFVLVHKSKEQSKGFKGFSNIKYFEKYMNQMQIVTELCQQVALHS